MTFAVTYCSDADVISLISADGAVGTVDDNRSGGIQGDESAFLADAIQHIQAKINFYLVPWYQLASMPGNTWIKWCAATMTACQLFRRRGEAPPDSLLMQENQYLEWLEEVRVNRAIIPPDGASDAKLIKSGAGMAMSNMTVDQRYRVNKIRYVPRISTGTIASPAGIPRYPDYPSSIFAQ